MGATAVTHGSARTGAVRAGPWTTVPYCRALLERDWKNQVVDVVPAQTGVDPSVSATASTTLGAQLLAARLSDNEREFETVQRLLRSSDSSSSSSSPESSAEELEESSAEDLQEHEHTTAQEHQYRRASTTKNLFDLVKGRRTSCSTRSRRTSNPARTTRALLRSKPFFLLTQMLQRLTFSDVDEFDVFFETAAPYDHVRVVVKGRLRPAYLVERERQPPDEECLFSVEGSPESSHGNPLWLMLNLPFASLGSPISAPLNMQYHGEMSTCYAVGSRVGTRGQDDVGRGGPGEERRMGTDVFLAKRGERNVP